MLLRHGVVQRGERIGPCPGSRRLDWTPAPPPTAATPVARAGRGSPPLSLALTGDRSPFSHCVDEHGKRALIRFSAAGDRPIVSRPSPPHGRQSRKTCVGQVRLTGICCLLTTRGLTRVRPLRDRRGGESPKLQLDGPKEGWETSLADSPSERQWRGFGRGRTETPCSGSGGLSVASRTMNTEQGMILRTVFAILPSRILQTPWLNVGRSRLPMFADRPPSRTADRPEAGSRLDLEHYVAGGRFCAGAML